MTYDSYPLKAFGKMTSLSPTLNTHFWKSFLFIESALERRAVRGALLVAYGCFLIEPSVAALTGDMSKAVQELQQSIFGPAWVTVGKIAAAGVGAVMSIARSSGMPFALGAGVAGGLHFFQKHTETAAACLL